MISLAPVPERPRRLAYLGTPTMAVPPLRALVAAGFEVAVVVTRTDKRRGRGGGLVPSPVKQAAHDLGLRVVHRVEDLVDDQALVRDVELGVVVAFGQMIKPPVLEVVPMVNLHFSLLPRWRGAAPVERALLAGDRVTGTCLMQLEEGLDTGPVFDRVEVPIGERETAEELRAALVATGSEQLVRCLTDGLGTPEPQTGEATYAAKITPDELRIDWTRPAIDVDRLVRLGGAWTTFRGERIKVVAVEVDDSASSAPGRIEGLTVGTGAGVLELRRVQPAGKAPMDASAWRNGARPGAGECFE